MSAEDTEAEIEVAKAFDAKIEAYLGPVREQLRERGVDPECLD